MDYGAEANACTGFLRCMEPTVRWAAGRYATSHSYLGADDLFQEAMEALVKAWKVLYPMPLDDLAKVGCQAVFWRLRRVQERSRASGEGEVVVVSLDSPPNQDGDEREDGQWSRLLGVAGDADCFFPATWVMLQRVLSPDARAVLRELVSPSPRTLLAVRRARARWAGRRGNWWRAEQVQVLGKGVGLPRKKARAALSEIRAAVYKIVGKGNAGNDNIQQGETLMAENKGLIPPTDPLEAGMPAAASTTDGKDKKKTSPAVPKAKKAKAKVSAAPKAKASKKKGKTNPQAFQKAGKVGVIDTIIEACLKGATKGQVHEKLTKRFPDRDLKGMRATVHIYLGGRLTKDKGYKINKKGSGKEATYTVLAPKEKGESKTA